MAETGSDDGSVVTKKVFKFKRTNLNLNKGPQQYAENTVFNPSSEGQYKPQPTKSGSKPARTQSPVQPSVRSSTNSPLPTITPVRSSVTSSTNPPLPTITPVQSSVRSSTNHPQLTISLDDYEDEGWLTSRPFQTTTKPTSNFAPKTSKVGKHQMSITAFTGKGSKPSKPVATVAPHSVPDPPGRPAKHSVMKSTNKGLGRLLYTESGEEDNDSDLFGPSFSESPVQADKKFIFKKSTSVSTVTELQTNTNSAKLSIDSPPDPVINGKRKRNRTLVTSTSISSLAAFDDDNDFCDSSISGGSPPLKPKTSFSLKRSKPPAGIKENQNDSAGSTHSKAIQDQEPSDSDEDGKIQQPKRRRTGQFLASDEEEEVDPPPPCDDTLDRSISHDGGASERPPPVSNTLGRCSTVNGEAVQKADPLLHPLLKKPAAQLSHEDIVELRTILLRIMDEICDIICKVSMDDLMTMVWQNYERLQKLLTFRKSIKNKADCFSLPTDHSMAPPMCPNRGLVQLAASSLTDTPGLHRTLSPSNASTPLRSPDTKPTSLGVTPSRYTDNSVKRMSNGNAFGSPIPCGDSFFEDDAKLTQSHAKFIASFKRKSVLSSPSQYGRSDVTATMPTPPVMSLSKQLTSGYNTSANDSVMAEDGRPTTSDFDFSYKISEHQGPVASKRQDDRNKQVITEDCIDDDMFDIDDFQFEEEQNEDTLPSMNRTPRRKSPTASTSGANQGWNKTDNSSNLPVVKPSSCQKQPEDPNKEFDGFGFAHSKETMKAFTSVFGLHSFRQHQLQAINASLLGNDCFILMPTGGGKSLCYQLPALVSGGVSIIVSPLKALIQDQVQRLNAMMVPAAQLSSDQNKSQADFIYTKLSYRKPEINLLYVTPEKISASDKLNSCLDNLYRRKILSRFVIDEAHCVSQWGHDFRPDYKKLNILREKYPEVPLMALTATATPRVRKDVIHQLRMRQTKWFVQSFNRPNLKLSVEPKKPSTLTADIIKLIKERFSGKCGIVYCLSRNECDSSARDLSKAGIQAVSYHAGLGDGERISIQEKWLNGNMCKVICATIAFGMGIDKADVRFVIHYSLPKSMEGYYQEAGRAGRDGQLAHCLLYYTYQDVKRLRRIIEMDQNANYESKRVHIDNLFQMVQYCENMADCRRAQLLNYLGEHSFDRNGCGSYRGSICDNCASKGALQLRDVTEDCKEIIKCVRSITSSGSRRGSDFTLLHFVEVFRGSSNSKIKEFGHEKLPLHGRGKSYTRHDAERLLRKLVIDGILMEHLQITAMDHTACYIRIGHGANDVMMGNRKIELHVQGNKSRGDVAKVGKDTISARDQLVEECYTELLELAKGIAQEHGFKNVDRLFPLAMLRQLAEETPLTVEEMTSKIDNLTDYKVTKYGADRFLDITTKYCVLISTAVESETAQTGPDHSHGPDPNWESPYFGEEDSAGSYKRRGRGGFRKKFGGRRKRGSGKSAGNKSSGAEGGAALNQYRYQKGSATAKRGAGQARGGNTRGRGTAPRGGGNSLGFLPAPAPKQRSFLGGSGGSYFG